MLTQHRHNQSGFTTINTIGTPSDINLESCEQTGQHLQREESLQLLYSLQEYPLVLKLSPVFVTQQPLSHHNFFHHQKLQS
jgi:hypothetical protein